MSDDLGNAAAVRYLPPADRAVQFVEAGGDLLLTLSTRDLPEMRDALLAAARRSSTFQGLVRASAGRVMALKAKIGLAGV
ncbi:hypothetical protein [uncultured Pseudokineococcus sp.]|uniref:hypothetical protein n=1 Tax=uncultured Pseudokineococcus sp. TaxID=1642928 RepID=UPI003456C769